MRDRETSEAMGPHEATATGENEQRPKGAPRDHSSDSATSATGRPRRPASHSSSDHLRAAGDRAASAIDATADLVRDFDGRAMVSQAGSLAGKHPGKAMVVALIAGFLLGRFVTRPSA